MRKYLSLLFLVVSFSINAQVSISGKIVDQSDGKALPGATIYDLSAKQGVLSDSLGQFDIELTGDSLEVSYVGYQVSRINNFQAGSYYTIALARAGDLQEVLVQADGPRVDLYLAEAIQTLGQRDLQGFQQLNPQLALNQVPGVYMHSGALNTNRITIRGIGTRSPFGTAKIRAYFDEIPLTNGIGETVIEDIDASTYDAIQIWKGPTASSYGAALGGVIRLQSLSTATEEKQQLSTQFEAGAYGLNRWVVASDYQNPDEGLRIRLNYNQTTQDGYRANNQYDRESFSAIGNLGGNGRHSSTILINYTDVKAFIPSSLNEEDYRNAPQKAAFTWASVKGFEDYQRLIAGLSHTYDWWKEPDGQILSSTVSLFSQFRDNYESRPFNILREDSWSSGFRATLDYRKSFRRSQPNAQIGIEWFNENYSWTTNITEGGSLGGLLSDNEEQRRYYNLFATLDWNFGPKWFAKLGFNYNASRYRLTDLYSGDDQDFSGNYEFDPLWSPRFSVGYFIRPRIQLFSTLSHGFSTPSLEETLNPDGSRNPDIQAERGWNYELGSRGSYLFGKLHYDIAIYKMQVKDLLVARRTDLDQFLGINAGKTLHNGLELRIQYDWLNGPSKLSSTVAYHYADFRFEDFVDGNQDYSGNRLTGVAPHQFNASLDWRTASGLFVFLGMEYLDAYSMRDDESIFSEPYQLVFGRIGWQGQISKHLQLEAYGGVNNILDEKYAAMILINAASFGGNAPRYYYPGQPRNLYGGLKVQYRWFPKSGN